MKTTWFSATLALVLGLGFESCSRNEEPAAEAPRAAQAHETEAASQAAPPADVSPESELEDIRTRLATVKKALFDEGEYNCCVQPSCDWCALHEGSCACFKNLQEGEAVCPGCGLGWHNGHGIAEGVDPKSVKWEITHSHPASGGEHHH